MNLNQVNIWIAKCQQINWACSQTLVKGTGRDKVGCDRQSCKPWLLAVVLSDAQQQTSQGSRDAPRIGWLRVPQQHTDGT